MKKKLIILAAVIGLAELAARFLGQTVDPQTRTDLALSAVNKGPTEVRLYETGRNILRPTLIAGYVLLACILFFPKAQETKKN